MKTCVDCGKEISYKSTRCQSYAMRLRWARGDYTPALRSKMRQAIASCHATTNFDREYWPIVLQDILNKRCRYRSVGNQAGPGLYEAADPWGLAANTAALNAVKAEAS